MFMSVEEFRNYMKTCKKVESDSEILKMFYDLTEEAFKTTIELNTAYHTPEEIVQIFSRLTRQEVDATFRLFPPFYTECGVNITVGKNVFINAGCKFQDHAGITIKNNVFIGHNVVIATLNHDFNPNNRAAMVPKPVFIDDNVWIGASVTILPGVTINKNAIVGAGSVVTKDVPLNAIVAGNPAKIIKYVEVE